MLTWIIVSIALLGAILNAKQMRFGFILWMISNTSLALINFNLGEYAQGFLFLCYLAISTYGFFSWKTVNLR